MNSIILKVCCIQNVDEAKLAVRYGASALGLVSVMPSGPGVISENKIIEIAQFIPPGISSFLLTSSQDARLIIEQQKRFGTDTIQIVDRLTEGTYREIKNALPGIKVVQVIHVLDGSSINEAVSLSDKVDALLLDSGNQSLDIKELGGTGRIHNWKLSRKIVEESACPVYLAGGLNPENIQQAIEEVNPFGVDVCSGVRTNGKLDEKKLALFSEKINQLVIRR